MSIIEELEDWGYRGEEIILRSDQGGAVDALKKKVAINERRKDDT